MLAAIDNLYLDPRVQQAGCEAPRGCVVATPVFVAQGKEPTVGTKYQNEPIHAPLQKVEKTSSFNDLGREDARRIAE